MSYKHIVLFKVSDQVTEDKFQEALEVLNDLGVDQQGVLSWNIATSIDTRKGRIIIEEGVFQDDKVFQLFRESEKHQRAVGLMRDIADWLVGDYIL